MIEYSCVNKVGNIWIVTGVGLASGADSFFTKEYIGCSRGPGTSSIQS
jgi:hypothetical protein